MNFTTKLSGLNVSVFNIATDNHDFESNLTVEWEFYTEMREWGVKDVGIYATKVYGEIEINYWGEEEGDKIETQEITSDAKGWELDTQSDIEWGNCICPQYIEVDYETRIITVIF
jgi:hypothetical protein